MSELSAVLTHSPPAVFNQYHSEFQPSHMLTHARTHARTCALQDLSARHQGNTKCEQLHTPPRCINRAHTYSHMHTHEGECVFLCVLSFSLMCVSLTGRANYYNCSPSCPLGERNIKIEQEMCVCLCVYREASRGFRANGSIQVHPGWWGWGEGGKRQ